MAVLDSVVKTAKSTLKNLGRSMMATQFPNDFEVYMCSLELTDSKDNTIDVFTFPISPESIDKSEPKRTTVVNTAGGITVLTSPVFTPQSISIKGNFGRTFKILLSGSDSVSLTGAAFSISAGKRYLYQLQGKSTSSLKMPSFDVGIKTGYGCIKILQSIVDKSNGVDSLGFPMKLYFYNMAFGESYLVTIPPRGITFSQNVSKNMIWEYNLEMTVIAPMEAVLGTKGAKGSLVSACASNVIQKGVNEFASSLSKGLLGNG